MPSHHLLPWRSLSPKEGKSLLGAGPEPWGVRVVSETRPTEAAREACWLSRLLMAQPLHLPAPAESLLLPQVDSSPALGVPSHFPLALT